MSEMKSYVVRSKFNIMTEDEKTVTMEKGDTLQFDGTTCIRGGKEYLMPKLNVAVNSGWIAVVGSENAYSPASANIKMRGATPQQEDTISSGVSHLSEEERVVHSLEGRKNFLKDHPDERAPTQNTAPPSVGNMPIISESNENSTVVSTGRFKTSAKSNVDMTKISSTQLRQIAVAAENPHAVGDVTGLTGTHEDPVRVAEGIQFSNTNISERSAEGMTRSPSEVAGSPNLPVSAEAGVKVGSVSERSKQSSPPAPEEVSRDAFEADSAEVPKEVEVEPEDSLDPSVKEGRYAVAKILHPDLPDWDFSIHWAKKMAKIREELSEDTIALRAIYASESEAIKRRIKKEFDLGL